MRFFSCFGYVRSRCENEPFLIRTNSNRCLFLSLFFRSKTHLLSLLAIRFVPVTLANLTVAVTGEKRKCKYSSINEQSFCCYLIKEGRNACCSSQEVGAVVESNSEYAASVLARDPSRTRILHLLLIMNPFSLFFFIDFQNTALHGRIQSLSYVRRLYGNAYTCRPFFRTGIRDSP